MTGPEPHHISGALSDEYLGRMTSSPKQLMWLHSHHISCSGSASLMTSSYPNILIYCHFLKNISHNSPGTKENKMGTGDMEDYMHPP